MLFGTHWTNKTRLHSLSLTVNEFSRERGNWEGTKEEIRTWIRLDDLDEILEHLSLFPSWRDFGTGWTSLQLNKSVWIFSVELCRKWQKVSSQRKKDEIDTRTKNNNNGIKGIICKNTTEFVKKWLHIAGLIHFFVIEYYSFTFPCSFLMWEM